MTMRVISNTTPIISLCAVQHEWILKELFQRIIIPSAVEQELRASSKPGSQFSSLSWVEVVEVTQRDIVQLLCKDLDQGEAETIALAKHIQADVVVIDEAAGYQIACLYDLPVVRTLYVLKAAKTCGVITQVKPIVMEMIRTGRWYSQRVLTHFLEDIGESSAR